MLLNSSEPSCRDANFSRIPNSSPLISMTYGFVWSKIDLICSANIQVLCDTKDFERDQEKLFNDYIGGEALGGFDFFHFFSVNLLDALLVLEERFCG